MPKSDNTAPPDAVVVKDIMQGHATQAFKVVEDFWKTHPTDQAWADFQKAIGTDEEKMLNDPKLDPKHKAELKEMFGEFHISGTDVDGKMKGDLTVSYGDNYDKIQANGKLQKQRVGKNLFDPDGDGDIDIELDGLIDVTKPGKPGKSGKHGKHNGGNPTDFPVNGGGTDPNGPSNGYGSDTSDSGLLGS